MGLWMDFAVNQRAFYCAGGGGGGRYLYRRVQWRGSGALSTMVAYVLSTRLLSSGWGWSWGEGLLRQGEREGRNCESLTGYVGHCLVAHVIQTVIGSNPSVRRVNTRS